MCLDGERGGGREEGGKRDTDTHKRRKRDSEKKYDNHSKCPTMCLSVFKLAILFSTKYYQRQTVPVHHRMTFEGNVS